MADYWKLIKNLFYPESTASNSNPAKIKFSPAELREMNDPTTAVGRLLNPRAENLSPEDVELFQYDLPYKEGYLAAKKFRGVVPDNYTYQPGLEFLQHGKGSILSSMDPAEAYNETMAATAEAYRSDALKMGIISPDDDKITQNNKIIANIKKTKSLDRVPIEYGYLANAYGEYSKPRDKITVSDTLEPFNSRLLHNLNASSFGLEGSGDLKRLSETEKRRVLDNALDYNLVTQIHELRHAEDARTPFDGGGHSGHFIGADPGLGDVTSGREYDIRKAALQRLVNMGEER